MYDETDTIWAGLAKSSRINSKSIDWVDEAVFSRVRTVSASIKRADSTLVSRGQILKHFAEPDDEAAL